MVASDASPPSGDSPPPLDAPPELVPGGVVDRYEIVRHVARGGMGSVWLAVQKGKHGFSRRVAIKTLLPEWTDDPKMRVLFLEEARISSKLHHANVAQVIDVGETSSGVYIVFEWVEGRSLEQLARDAVAARKKLPLGTILSVLADVCAGLHAAHELVDADGAPLQVVHRDVTPANVLVSDAGFAKLIDFGIAKARDRAVAHTRTGFVRGTPQYMAPEQATRDPMDRRADVWSVGAILYRLLAGRPPFRTRDALVAFLESESALTPLPPEVPADVLAIVRRSLRAHPGDRYPTAEAMRHALDRAAHQPGRELDAVSARGNANVTTEIEKRSDAAPARRVVLTPEVPSGLAHAIVAAAPAQVQVVVAAPVVEESRRDVTTEPPAAQTPRTKGRARGETRGPRTQRALVIAAAVAAVMAGVAIALAMCAPT